MFLILIWRELLTNLMTFRFLVAMVVTLLLVVANTVVLIADYERRLTSYNTAVKHNSQEIPKAKTYSDVEGKIRVDRPPNPLSIFNAGLDRRLGNSIHVRHTLVPTLWDTKSHSADNPFLNLFSSVDLVLIFQVILSLLALLFAHDAIAGEREAGTLRLTMTNPVSRPIILLTKYISAMMCLILPLVMSVLLALILFSVSGSISLSGDDWIRIGGILLISIIYLSVFYLIGLLISTLTRRTATALMLSMVIWSSLVLIYPSLSIFAVNRLLGHIRSIGIRLLVKLSRSGREFEREERRFFEATIPFAGENNRLQCDILKGHWGVRGRSLASDAITLKYFSAEKSQSGRSIRSQSQNRGFLIR